MFYKGNLPKVYKKKIVHTRFNGPVGSRRNGNLRRRNFVSGNRKVLPPQYKKTIQTLGNGSTTRFIEKDYDVAVTDNVNAIDFGDITSTSSELDYLLKTYMWFKFDMVIVTIYPSSENTITKWLINWQNENLDSTDLNYSDSTKIVQIHQVRNQYVKYRTPNATITTGLTFGNLNTLNYKNWIPSKEIYDIVELQKVPKLPGALKFITKYGTSNIHFRVSLKFRFRGSQIPESSALLNVIANQYKNNAITQRVTVLKEAIKHMKEKKPVVKLKAESDEESCFDEEDEKFIKELDTQFVKV